ncbi:glutathione S-transferase C-terminal domain-containing protein [Lentilactobacillus raoultii]|uniref:Glutathione S-transferase C-terminal domain-containing protein n=1 Tax=Lentilactobacillus raoultii TaxID=1987503 RepID=A0ABW3PPJ4_9LACO|nr:glutathione S-transferase C-terminal domain-containing protein [Lentilactobacillus raoultii]
MANEKNAACAWHPRTSSDSLFEKKFTTGELPVEANRYHLVWGRFCPWATPVAILIDLVGLNKVISKTAIYNLRHAGIDDDWFFGALDDDQDPVLKTTRLSENYRKTDPQFKARPTIPALIDLKTGKVVNNSSDELMNELSTAWQSEFAVDVLDIFPNDQSEAILELNQMIVGDLTSIPGKLADVTSQTEYEKLAQQYFDRLDWLEERLGDNRFLLGDRLTQPDIRLFVDLVRFDVVFYFKDKLNKQRLDDYPNLWRYARECYQIPAFRQSTDFQAIKEHFFKVSDEPVESFDRIMPVGPDESRWSSF